MDNARRERCIVTFPTTVGAMAMESACAARGVPGRLIPLPRSIGAGCGMCWAAPKEAREAVEALVMEEGIAIEGIFLLLS